MSIPSTHFLSLSFSLAEFKPRLETLLKEVVLLSEVSDLAAAVEQLSHHEGDNLEIDLSSRKVKFFEEVWTSERAPPKGSVADSDDESDGTSLDKHTDRQSTEAVPVTETKSGTSETSRTSSSALPLKGLLEYWDEPVNKMDRVSDL